MNSRYFGSAAELGDWLRGHLVAGMGLRYPYARKWEIGGCEARHSLWSWPADRVEDLARGLLSCGYPVAPGEEGVVITVGEHAIRLSANRSGLRKGNPDAYLFYVDPDPSPKYVGNSPEVVVEMLRNYTQPAPEPVDDERIEIGFPGRSGSEWTYVGSWQWDVHGEARDHEFIARAAAATLNAIKTRRPEL